MALTNTEGLFFYIKIKLQYVYMLIDTHGHVNFNAFKEDSKEILEKTLKNNIWVIMPGTQYSTSKRAVDMAQQYTEGVYAAIGIHPIHLEKRDVDVLEVQSDEVKEQPWMLFETRAEEFDYEKYKELASDDKVVAIGEVGLDYYRQPKGKQRRQDYRARQKDVFEKQIDLALELNLPVIIHCRVAHNDLLELLQRKQQDTGGKIRGVIHSYTGDIAMTKELLSLGFYFGFNGLILKDVPALPPPKEIVSFIPLDRIILETDSPYLIPPIVKEERNEPMFVEYVAKEIARIKSIDISEVAKQTTQNAKTLFQI